jgi:hypothetical protein
MFIRSAGGVVLSQERGHGGGGFRLSSLRKSAIVAGLRGRYRLLRAVGEVSALRATDLHLSFRFIAFN